MRGHLRKRYLNSWTIVLDLGRDPASGKRKQQWISVKGTRKEAEKQLAEHLHRQDTGSYSRPEKITLAEYLEKWLTDYASSNISPVTAQGYASIIHSGIIPAIGQIKLTQLQPAHISAYYSAKMAEGCSTTTVRHHHACLHRTLAVAVKWGLVQRNSADAVTPPPVRHREMHTLDEKAVNDFLEAARHTPYYVLFYLALSTGMRRSELLALRWLEVDLILCQLSVTRSLHQLHDGTILYRPPKTAKGKRLIALSPASALLLAQHKKEMAELYMMHDIVLSENDLVFSKPDRQPLLPGTISQAWRRLAQTHGFQNIRLHDARHTHASLLLKQGVHPKIVQERLGHANIALTLDTYSHITPGMQRAAAEKFDELITSKKS